MYGSAGRFDRRRGRRTGYTPVATTEGMLRARRHAGLYRVLDSERAQLHAPSRALTMLALALIGLGGVIVALGSFRGYRYASLTPLCVVQLVAGGSATALAMAVIWLRPLWFLRPPLARPATCGWGLTLGVQLAVAATLARRLYRARRAGAPPMAFAERVYLSAAMLALAALSLCEGAVLLAARRGTARAFDAERALDDARAAKADAARDAHCDALESQDPFDAEGGAVGRTFQAEARRIVTEAERTLVPKARAGISQTARRLISETERLFDATDALPLPPRLLASPAVKHARRLFDPAGAGERDAARDAAQRASSGTQLTALSPHARASLSTTPRETRARVAVLKLEIRALRQQQRSAGSDAGSGALVATKRAEMERLVRALAAAEGGGDGGDTLLVGGDAASAKAAVKRKKKKSKKARLASTYGKFLDQ